MTPGEDSESSMPTIPGEVLFEHLLPHFRRVLIVGAGAVMTGLHLRRRSVARVHAVDPDARQCDVAADHLAQAVTDLTGISDEAWDAQILLAPSPEQLAKNLETARLSESTYVYVVVPAQQAAREEHLQALVRAAGPFNAGLYTHWVDEASGTVVLLFIPASYSPLEHARNLFDTGHPGFAFRVLELLPDAYRENPDTEALIASEMQLCQLAWLKLQPDPNFAGHFGQAQTHFYTAVSRAPRYAPAYQCQAEYWRQLGEPGMGARLLRSLLHVAPDPSAKKQHDQLAALSARSTPPPSATPPPYPADYRPRVLCLFNQRPHFGIDVLFDGLCRVLGPDHVVDFPAKGTLHGDKPEALKNYPCRFDWPGHGIEHTAVLDDLRAGRFDAILFGDPECSLPRELVHGVLDARGDVPFFIVDALDEATDTRHWLNDYFGRHRAAGYFKREMLHCVDYGANVWPLPFACPDHLVREDVSGARDTPVFWAGHRQFGLRRLYLEYLEEKHSWDLNKIFEPDEYADRLRRSSVGINIFGYGFDTVRFWELPANGCLLLSERLPIHIPQPFTHGENAIFWDDLPELDRLLDHYLAEPEEAQRIAAAGHAHLRAHHTGSRRAEQMLGWMHAHS
jgi:hypothetical protein